MVKMKMLCAILCLVSCVATPARAESVSAPVAMDVEVGITREAVLAQWGEPRGAIRRDRLEVLLFEGPREVELVNGRVTKVVGAVPTASRSTPRSFPGLRTDYGPDTDLDLDSMLSYEMVDVPEWVPHAAMAIMAGLTLLMLISCWRIFTKADEPGWATLIPIYNVLVTLRIARKPLWWFFLLMIPVVSLIVSVIMYVSLAHNFGKSAGFGLGLLLFPIIFYPVLAFGSAEFNPL